MHRQDLIVVSVVYALLIAAGHAGPLLNQLKKLPWNDPLGLRIRSGSNGVWADRLWAAQDRLFTKVVSVLDPPEVPTDPIQKTGPVPPVVQVHQAVPVLVRGHRPFHRARPLARIRPIPVPEVGGTERLDRERGPRG